ncbi:SLAP domain-containing protein [Chungangia koreensis]|uniref:SLAP domain-containing protein n=1 Tax=Chungangia koreensis TaxID=752657 RepID=A0ABV8X4P8_9LACT
MQKLQFEASWDKALSKKDRVMIEELFESTKEPATEPIRFTPIWEAENYKKELLITVLIHNFTETDLNFIDAKLRYDAGQEQFAEHTFNLPNVTVPSSCSMPWTFIFPADARERVAKPENGKLTYV